MNIDALSAWLVREMPARRFGHAQRVAVTAAQLARDHGLSDEQAFLAGLLHDLCRDFEPSRLLQTAVSFGIVSGEVGTDGAILLHGPVAAEMVCRQLGVTDEAILEAIRVHTTGSPEMGPISQVVFLADRLEPGREYPEREELYEIARRDLCEGVRRALLSTMGWLRQQGVPIHPATAATYERFSHRVED